MSPRGAGFLFGQDVVAQVNPVTVIVYDGLVYYMYNILCEYSSMLCCYHTRQMFEGKPERLQVIFVAHGPPYKISRMCGACSGSPNYSGTCLKWSPSGQKYLDFLERWLPNSKF